MSHRIRSFYAVLGGVIAAAIVGTGCSAAGTSHGGQHAKVALKFQVTGTTSAGGTPTTLKCDPVGGSQQGAATACTTLLNLKKKNPFAPLPKGVNCPMLLRSNKRIIVTGTWFGVTVHRVVVDGGCDTALFDSLNKIIR